MPSYNSTTTANPLEGLSGGVTPGTIGRGWTLNVGDVSTDTDLGDGGLTNLITPDWVADTAQNVFQPLSNSQVILTDQDGSRHVFTATSPSILTRLTSIGGSLGGSLSLTPAGAALGSLFTSPSASSVGGPFAGLLTEGLAGEFCLDQSYTAPAGVHLGLFRMVYVDAPGVNECVPSSSSTRPVTVGYIAERPDGLRFVYSAAGELLDEIDRAGVDLRYAYDYPLTALSNDAKVPDSKQNLVAASTVTSPVTPLPLSGRLRAVYETNVGGCTTIAAQMYAPSAPCRAIRVSYDTDSSGGCAIKGTGGSAVCITDPAQRTTTYTLSKVVGSATGAATYAAPAELLRVTDQDGSSFSYTYGGCANATSMQLCTITDPNNNQTGITYVTSSSATSGPLVATIKDRRAGSTAVTTTLSYSLGQLGYGLSATTEVTTPNINGACTVADQQSANCRIAQYTVIDSAGRVGEADVGVVAGATSCSGRNAGTIRGGSICAVAVSIYGWDTNHHVCQRDENNSNDPVTAADDNVCTLTQLGMNDSETGQANSILTSDRSTTFTYGPDGSVLIDAVANDSGSVTTTYGYQYQYWTASGSVSTYTATPSGGGAVTTPTFSTSALFLIADKTAMLTPNGNAVSSGFTSYETTYYPDDLPAQSPNALQTDGTGDPHGKTICGTGATAGTPTSNSGVVCEVDAPKPTGAKSPSNCQASGSSTMSCQTMTYDGWGQKMTMTTPLAHTSDAGSNRNAAYH